MLGWGVNPDVLSGSDFTSHLPVCRLPAIFFKVWRNPVSASVCHISTETPGPEPPGFHLWDPGGTPGRGSSPAPDMDAQWIGLTVRVRHILP